MRFLDLTLPDPAANLALDEALLDVAQAAGDGEVLRLWEPAAPMVVVGRSSVLSEEVRVDVCRAEEVPILRRASGGAAILAGPGCLMYAVVLDVRRRPALKAVDLAHRLVLDRLAAGMRPYGVEVACKGTSDLAIGQRKFSGNSIRAKQTHLLYHGTLLYDFPLEWIARYLCQPPRQPAYREGRPHEAFVMNLPLTREQLVRALRQTWDAEEPLLAWPEARTADLVSSRYGCPAWTVGREASPPAAG